jgi:uncharacterized membrane protein YeiB
VNERPSQRCDAPSPELAEPTPAPGGPPSGRSGGGRIPGIDLARAIAILGMLAVHVGPTDVEGPAGTLYALPHGRAAILFGLVAGVGVSLLAAGRSRTRTQARVRLLWRAAVLLPLGLWLQELDHNVFVILQDYALLFVVATVLIAVPDRWLLALAGASATVGSLVHLAGHVTDPEAFARRPVVWDVPVTEIAHRLVLSGPYPLLTWLAPFALGMWLGRRDLRSPLLWWRLVLLGGSVTLTARLLAVLLQGWWGAPPEAVTWDHLVVDDPHSQMPLWVVGATGSAVFMLGASLLLADRARAATWPLVAVGQLAFTVYVGHLLALHLWRDPLTSDAVGPATGLVLAFTAVAAVVATAWRAVLPRGPLELILNPPRLPSRTSRR